MPISGYDPADIDELLEGLLSEDEKAEFLTGEEWEAYESGDESLVDLLEPSEIERIFERRGVTPEDGG
jgi:hypothetical protein